MKHRIVIAIIGLVIIAAVLLLWSAKSGDLPNSSSRKANATSASQSQQSSSSTAAFDHTRYSVTDPNSIWVVVNKHHPLKPVNYAPQDLTSVSNGQVMRAEAATALTSMFAGAKTAGLTITAASAYRSYTTQVSVYNQEVANYGKAKADSESARPGFSEHQTGLAVDIAGGGCSITDCFGTTAEGKWATAHAYEYGFILRYTADKTPITGYRAEAWHFRYVGKDLALQMHKTGATTLEEFFTLDAAPDYY